MYARPLTSFFCFVLIILVVPPADAQPPIIRSIDFVGSAAVANRELIQVLSSKETLPFAEDVFSRDLHAVVEMYRRQGYLSAQINAVRRVYTPDSSLVDLAVIISEGRKSVVGAITVEGASQLRPADMLDQFDVKAGDPLDESLLERDLDALLSRYERLGYPFAQCRVAGMTEREADEYNILDITLAVSEGQRVTIDEVRVEGNKETDASVVVRETRLASGEVFNPVKIDAIRQRLNRLNIFSSVAEPQLYLRGKSGGLLIKVQEGNTNTFDGVIGYIPGTLPGESGYLTGLVSVSMRNVLGTGRKLSVRWQREDRHSQELGVRYVEPWVFSLPANIGGGFFQRQQDTSYVRRVFDLKAELMLTDEFSVGGLFGTESVIPSADSTINRVFKSSTTTLGVDLQYDSRDDPVSPRSGARYHTEYNYGRKRIGDVPAAYASRLATNVTVQRFTLDLDAFVTMFPRQVLAVGFHGRELRSGQYEEGEMFRFGGTRTLRGYRENQFLGSRVAWSNTEYRFLLSRRSFLLGFIDTGYYYHPADAVRSVPKSDAFKYGYGIGVQLESGLGILGVSFALGKGDSFSQGKIHFGIINDF